MKNALTEGTNVGQEASIFNNSFAKTASQIRDFLVLHYYVNQREGSAFWKDCRNMEIPESLNGYLSEFKQTGKITLPNESLFTYESYLQVLVGQKYLRRFEQFRDSTIKPNQLEGFFTNVKAAINAEVGKIDSHSNYLSKAL